MTLSAGIAILLGFAALALVALEVARELRGQEPDPTGSWRPLLTGALTAAVLLGLYATLSLFHSVAVGQR